MRALISVSDKTGLIELARGLTARGCEVISTGGTASTLARAGLAVTSVSDVTGFPEMMDGRVKTLHPHIHGGILARRENPGDLEAASRHGIGLIDLVIVNLYPFDRAAANAAITVPDLIEEIDIGGPSLVRAAAKNFEHVLIVVKPSCYERVLQELDRSGGPSLAFRLELAQQAFAHTAAYDTLIASTLSSVEVEEGGLARGASSEAARLLLTLSKVRDLRYGENPHQKGWWYSLGERSGFAAATVVQGKELSYTNLLDLDAALRIVQEFVEPAAAVIKHTNPCGAATAASITEAYVRARDADPLSAFGGIVGLNRSIDEDTARALTSTFIEAVVAPDLSDRARTVFSARPNLRVVTVTIDDEPAGRPDFRSILGGMLAQDRDVVREARQVWPISSDAGLFPRVVTRRSPNETEWAALRFAWRVMAHVKSNAIVFTARDRTLAIGAGQMSRVDAVRVAVMKAGEDAATLLAGSVAASDAFFPFRDGVDAIAAAGATAIVQPGGSARDADVISAADEHGLAMVFTGTRHFRH